MSPRPYIVLADYSFIAVGTFVSLITVIATFLIIAKLPSRKISDITPTLWVYLVSSMLLHLAMCQHATYMVFNWNDRKLPPVSNSLLWSHFYRSGISIRWLLPHRIDRSLHPSRASHHRILFDHWSVHNYYSQTIDLSKTTHNFGNFIHCFNAWSSDFEFNYALNESHRFRAPWYVFLILTPHDYGNFTVFN